MSRTIDQRVVEMQFNNRHFEQNVLQTMSTLDKLKQRLNLSGASKGLENIGAAAKNVDMTGLESGVGTIQAKFSALQVMAVTALANITNSALNAGKRITAALTIDPIKTGFQEYETQINAIQTILANTQSKGTNLKDVTGALDELNKYADMTIYNFTEMTRNIGTFTAAGVDLDTSVSAIKGIANLAAVSGSNSQQASTAMYQLSQALATGTVKLMDWNSVVNAGMGGQVFQDSLKETARVHGINIDGMIEKEGSFRDTLQNGWLSSSILTETLAKFTGDLSEEQLKSIGYTDQQITEILKLGKTANDAATKVKTFTQLFDTLKEAAQSGWTKSWEIIVGDFEEAKALLTEVSDSIGGMIGKSAEARNTMLQGWKDLGGRTALIDSFRNMFEGIGSVIKPITEALREIFPPTTAKQLYNITVAFKNFTEKLKLSATTAKNVKNTFKGLFAVIDIIVEVVKAVAKGAIDLVSNLSGIQNGVLGITGAISGGISGFRDYIKETNILGISVKNVTNFIGNIINKIKEFGRSLKDSFKESSSFEKITESLSSIFEAFGNLNFEKGFDLLNSGLFAGILLAIRKFITGLSNPFEGVSGVLENLTGVLDDVRGCFEAYQTNLQAGTLLKIASAIGILAVSLVVISGIDSASLTKALMAMTVLFGQLLGSLTLFSKITTNLVGVTKSIGLMIGLSIAVSILAGALKKMASVSIVDTIKGLTAIGILMAELGLFLSFTKLDTKLTTTAIGIVVLASGIRVLVGALKNIGGMGISEIGKGLLGIGALLAGLTIFSRSMGKAEHVLATGASMLLLSVAIKSLASSIKLLGGMSLASIGKSLLAMGGALTAITIAMRFMPKNTVGIGAGLVVVGTAMNILSKALSKFGGMSTSEIGKSLVVMGGALAELAVALNLMNGTMAGSASLIVAATALSIVASVMKNLGKISWGDVAKGLIALAGSFAVIGVAGALLTPLIPSILGLAGAFALIGISMVGVGAGLALIGVGISAVATGFMALATVGSVGATSIVAALKVIITGIADTIPAVIEKIGQGIIMLFKTLGVAAPVIAESLLLVITEVLKSLATYAPKIVDFLMEFLIGILESLANNIPRLVASAIKVIVSFFKGISDALGTIDTESLLKGIVGVGILSGLMLALSAIAGLIPGAMIGVLGIGIVIAELALVLAAIGGLSKIPGLSWLIEEGGNFLQTIGTAIGKFIGGIAGGFMNGMSSSFPKLGLALSDFMMNLEPFISGVKTIDGSVAKGMSSLVKTILLIAAADVVTGITSWLTGGNSMEKFAKQLVPFGEGLKDYSNAIEGIDAKAITNSATAAKSLSKLAENLPKKGGILSWFKGQNDLSEFGEKLVPFGKGLKEYSLAVAGIDSNAITNSATAAKALTELANNLPNSGGIVSWFTGDNSIDDFGSKLIPFASGLKEYSKSIAGIDTNAITNSATAAKALAELSANLPNSGGLVSFFTGDNDMLSFGAKLVPFGTGLKLYANSISGIDTDAIINSATAAKSLTALAENLPNMGGLVSLFTGDQNLASFGIQLVPFGRSLKDYSLSVAGIDANAVNNSSIAVNALAKLAEALPNTGGLFSFFTGDADISSFGMKLIPFGRSLKEYSLAIAGIDMNTVTNSATAATSLATLATNLPTNGGLVSLFTGDNDISLFGAKLVPFGKSLKDYSLAIAGIDANAITNSANAAKSLASLSDSLPTNGGLVSFFTGDNDMSSFAKNLVPFGAGLKSYSDAIAGVNPEAITNSATAAKSLASLANSLGKSGGLVNLFTGDSGLSSFGTKLVPFGKGLKEYSVSVSGMNIESVNNSVSAVKSLSSMLKNMNSISTKGVDSFKNSINTLAKVNVDGFVKAFSGSSSKLTSIGIDIANYIDKGFNSNKSKLTKTATTLANDMAKSISDKSTTFNNAGIKIISELTAGINKNTTKVKTAVTSAVKTAISGIREYYDSFNSAGSYLVSGFANGISANSYKAAAKSKAMANAAATAAKKELKEHSPSKVFYKIGDFAGLAFVNALSDYGSKSYKSGTEIAESARNGLSYAIGRIADVIDSGIDTEPTIRPVLDLSNVSSGARKINGMFGLAPSIGALSSVKAINSTFDKNIQNELNGDIVSAIKDLKNTINKSSGAVYNVNGITYDDGSNVRDAVETLIRAAKMERRV